MQYRDEHSVPFDESDEIILTRLKEHLDLKTEGSLVDYILDFCDLNEYRVEEVAELVKQDKELRVLLKQDCVFHGIFKNPNKLKDW